MTVAGFTLTAMRCDDPTEVDLSSGIDEPSLAWSDVVEMDEPGRAPWRAVWGRVAAVLAGCLMAAVLVVLAWRELPARQGSEEAPAPSAEAVAAAQADADTPSTAPTVAPRPPLPAAAGTVAQKMTTPPHPQAALPSDPDSIYLQLLSDAGVKAPTREKAIANGHLICQQLAQGSTVDDVKAEVNRVNPSLGVNRSNDTVYAAIVAYCPQYDNRGER